MVIYIIIFNISLWYVYNNLFFRKIIGLGFLMVVLSNLRVFLEEYGESIFNLG